MIFMLGGVFSARDWQPYRFIKHGYWSALALIKQSEATRPVLLQEQTYKGDGVITYDQKRAYEGYTLMQGWFAEGLEVRLVDMDGKILRSWPVDFHKIWPEPVHVVPSGNIPATRFNYTIQGISILNNGSVVFNFTELGSVKMDKCGKILWKLDRMTHHSITSNKDGSFWIPAKNDIRKIPDNLLLYGMSKQELMDNGGNLYEDLLLKVDENGRVIKEISILQALEQGGFEHKLLDARRISKKDPTHVNDIEVVTPELAKKIDDVKEGDLLVSLRQMHMLVIIDSVTGRIKWHQTGPWVRQHDPDINDEGIIEVFNNHLDYSLLGLSGIKTPGSNLISFDPSINISSIIYPQSGEMKFYSSIMGTHQRLPNGNRMITESMAGRVFEIDAQGDVVWEYVKPYDDAYASLIANAIRYDKDYFNVSDWSCQ